MLEPGITAIVGPNGSGKSNISDAVLWVLGERSARNLRGQAMEDIIFSGSAARKAVSMAEVDLVLDNSDGTLPVDYDEVSITRRMYRSGESEYLINGVVCRRMDVLDILHDSGLGTGTHSIISQGSLDSILQSRPEDRRALIEEAAGVLKHKQRKARSERKLERMDQHLLRIRDINREVERQLGPLERKAKRAMAYKGLHPSWPRCRWTWQSTICACCRESGMPCAHRKASLPRCSTRNRSRRRLRMRPCRSCKPICAGIRKARARRPTSCAGGRASEQLDSAPLLLRERSAPLRPVVRRETPPLRCRFAAPEALRAQLDESRDALLDAQRAKAAAEESLTAIARERDEVSRAFKDLRRDISKLEQDESRLVRDGDRLRKAKDKAADALSSGIADEKLLAAQLEDATRRSEEASARMEDTAKRFAEAEEALSHAVSADEESRKAAASAFAEVDAGRKELAKLRDDAARLSAQVVGLEEAQRASQAANKALTWALDRKERAGVAWLADGCAAGARRCARHRRGAARRIRLARSSSTMPERSIGRGWKCRSRSKKASPRSWPCRRRGCARAGFPRVPNGAPGVALLDVVTCDERARKAVRHLLADVVLCDTVDEARACAQALGSLAARGAWPARTASSPSFGHRALSVRPAAGSVGVLERHRELEQARAADGSGLARTVARGRRAGCSRGAAARSAEAEHGARVGACAGAGRPRFACGADGPCAARFGCAVGGMRRNRAQAGAQSRAAGEDAPRFRAY